MESVAEFSIWWGGVSLFLGFAIWITNPCDREDWPYWVYTSVLFVSPFALFVLTCLLPILFLYSAAMSAFNLFWKGVRNVDNV